MNRGSSLDSEGPAWAFSRGTLRTGSIGMGAVDMRFFRCAPVEAAGIVPFPSKLFRPGANGFPAGFCMP